MSDLVLAPVVFIMGLVFIYLGCRGWQARGIVIWQRTGEDIRIDGRLGRFLGTILILAGGAALWFAFLAAHLPVRAAG